MFRYFRERRRRKLRAQPFPAAWRAVLERDLPYYRRLPEAARGQLEAHTQILLAEKNFEGCGGFAMNDDARVLIAGQAALLLLNDDRGYFPGLYSVLVYPRAFWAEVDEPDEAGIVIGGEMREGEAWSNSGAIVLSWSDIRRDLRAFNGRNVILHEFGHWLHDAEGASERIPLLGDPLLRDEWGTVMKVHYREHVRAVEAGEDTVFDPYGAEDPAEFLAVLTESFFEQPLRVRRSSPDLYRQLCLYYRQDPAVYFAGEA